MDLQRRRPPRRATLAVDLHEVTTVAGRVAANYAEVIESKFTYADKLATNKSSRNPLSVYIQGTTFCLEAIGRTTVSNC